MEKEFNVFERIIVNGGNYFNEGSFKETCDLLDMGALVEIYIDCIGHSRTLREGKIYQDDLLAKYGDRLVITKLTDYPTYAYKLKNL